MAQLTPQLHDVYGCSGCGLIAHAGPAELAARPDSVGRPVMEGGVEVEIVSPEGAVVPAGISGSLRVRGPVVSQGFFNAEDALRGAEHFAGGWYYPGEIAVLDVDGFLVLRGRVQEAIHLPSRSLFPQEIEDVLTRHRAVAEAAVVGGKGEAGEELVAFVVPGPGFLPANLAAHCQALLSPECRPKRIYTLDALPRTGNGKLDRPALKAEAAARQVRA